MALTIDTISTLTEAIAKVYESNLTELVLQRLDSFGYEPSEDDVFGIGFSMQKVESSIKNNCNVAEIPDGLMNIAVDMMCADFLNLKKSFGQLEDDLESIAQNIKLGDTSVQFSNDLTPEQKFDSAINYLLTGHDGDFARYRKMVW